MTARPKISARHALTEKESEFVKVYLAFGETNVAEAYRSSHLEQRLDGQYVEPPRERMSLDDLNLLKVIPPRECTRLGKQLLAQQYIQDYIAEIKRPPGDTARTVIAEQALFADEAAARSAATKILEQEDKLGFKDAVERWKIGRASCREKCRSRWSPYH